MKKIEIKKIENLLDLHIFSLVNESKRLGFLFLERLVDEYKNKINQFTKPGEILLGVFTDNEIIAIGGLNRDTFSNDPKIGRLRRFYVQQNYRRSGIGTLLLNEILLYANNHFEAVVLYADTEEASLFYCRNGFVKNNKLIKSTHYFRCT